MTFCDDNENGKVARLLRHVRRRTVQEQRGLQRLQHSCLLVVLDVSALFDDSKAALVLFDCKLDTLRTVKLVRVLFLLTHV